MSNEKALNNRDYISVQTADFVMADEYQRLCDSEISDGAVVVFVGLVREFSQNKQIKSMFLEHYPAMTENALQTIVTEARSKWPLGKVSLIHRIGYLAANAQIVMVGVTSQHRHAAFAASEFIMDFLKIRAPFWKKEMTSEGDFWVAAKSTDNDAATKWLSTDEL
ncbi:molybdopterin synthase catalytic subunit MoaE [Paraglaciecola sp.]|uniref:molybdopterin synthase catalytic subunit MoaE n=1 Tax=Paraglaciecola sp. TaxID=1920173 RepID=UPI0030F428A1